MVTVERFAQGMTFPEYLAQMRSNKERFTERQDVVTEMRTLLKI